VLFLRFEKINEEKKNVCYSVFSKIIGSRESRMQTCVSFNIKMRHRLKQLGDSIRKAPHMYTCCGSVIQVQKCTTSRRTTLPVFSHL